MNQVFVTAYAVTRHYGGSEEGGWWYNDYEPLQTIACSQAKAEKLKELLADVHADEAHGDIYSVLGGCEVQVRIEQSPAASETTERPHYS